MIRIAPELKIERFIYLRLYCINMVEYKTILRNWGNSLGILVPKEKLKEENIKENQMVKVTITSIRRLRVNDIFGKLKKWNKSTNKILESVDRDLDS